VLAGAPGRSAAGNSVERRTRAQGQGHGALGHWHRAPLRGQCSACTAKALGALVSDRTASIAQHRNQRSALGAASKRGTGMPQGRGARDDSHTQGRNPGSSCATPPALPNTHKRSTAQCSMQRSSDSARPCTERQCIAPLSTHPARKAPPTRQQPGSFACMSGRDARTRGCPCGRMTVPPATRAPAMDSGLKERRGQTTAHAKNTDTATPTASDYLRLVVHSTTQAHNTTRQQAGHQISQRRSQGVHASVLQGGAAQEGVLCKP
jgi:hypothetical protein